MSADEFEAAQRAREWFHGLTIPPGMWSVIRVDGRGFSRLTADRWEKPFDPVFSGHMVDAARALVTNLGAVYGYTESDEISILLRPSFDLFGRSLEKLVSVSAGLASAEFTMAAQVPAHFDSRVWVGASVQDVVDYFSWRQADAARCALNGWCYWVLRMDGLSRGSATSKLKGMRAPEKHDLLFAHGVNFNERPAWQRRGVGLVWREVEHVGADPRTGEEKPVARRGLVVDRELPMGDEYRAMVAEVAS